MKNKISRILGIGLTIAMVTSLLTVAAPVSAGTLSLSNEFAPTNPFTPILKGGSDITDMAVVGTTIYVVSAQSTNATTSTQKSTNGGTTWATVNVVDTIANPSFSAANEVPKLVVTAPGDANIVAIVTTNTTPSNNLWYSTDGGTTFSLIGQSADPINTINDIAISPVISGARYITLAGQQGTLLSDIQYLNLGGLVSTWTSLTGNAVGVTSWVTPLISSSVSFLAIAYSPNFAGDRTLTAVGTDGTNSLFEIASFSTQKWNSAAAFGTAAQYPKNILAIAPTAADISLAPTYLSADTTLRLAFVAVSTGLGTGKLVRLVNFTQFNVADGDYSSVAFNGTDLVAGHGDSNVVTTSANPTAATPTTTDTAASQSPGGVNMVKVAWSGTNVVAGTRGTSSAFAVSGDKGVTFNDVNLIDTTLTSLRDVAVSPDNNTTFLVTDGSGASSVWRKTGTTWVRVLTEQPAVTTHFIRISGNNTYLFDTGSTNLLFSSDAGEKSWLLRSLVSNPVDAAVESAQVAYALTAGGTVYKTTNGGFTWDSGASTGLGNGATITSIATNQLIVGGTAGGIAWSTDGSASATTWTRPSTQPGGLTVFATADNVSNGRIYIVTSDANGSPKRWQVGTSTSWSDLDGSTSNLTGAGSGIALVSGALYVLTDDSITSNMSFISRTLAPTAATPASTDWSRVSAGSATTIVKLAAMPSALKSSTGPKLSAVNVGGSGLYSLTDTLATGTTAVPAPTLPVADFNATINPVAGTTQPITFSWPRLSAASTEYELDIALDSAFTQAKTTFTKATTNDPAVMVIGPAGADGIYAFQPGTTYYWRVRVTKPLLSGYSAVRKFAFPSVQSVQTPFQIVEPAIGSTDVQIKPILSWTADPGNAQYPAGAKWYEVTMSEDPSFAIPEWSHNVQGPAGQPAPTLYGVVDALKYSTTYYWRVRAVYADPFVQGTKVITPAGEWKVGAFTTMAAPATATVGPTGPAATQTVTVPGPTQTVTSPPQTQIIQQQIPSWMLMTIIIIGAILVIALLVLIMRTRKTA